jgi:hypothetical protein
MLLIMHPSQKFERSPFWNGLSCGIEMYGVDVTVNGMTSILNSIKSANWFRSYRDTHMDRENGDVISLNLHLRKVGHNRVNTYT